MLSLRPEMVRRYVDVLTLLRRHGGQDLVAGSVFDDLGVDDVPSHADAPAHPEGTDGEEGRSPSGGPSLAKDLEQRGPAWIKLGQLLATRSDLLPPALIDDLSRLQDDIDPVPFDAIREVVEMELGARLTKVFDEFDEVPMATASIGQVHRARLRDGRVVAVKVQRPGIREQLGPDLDAFAEIAALLERHSSTARLYDLQAIVRQFRSALATELDYRREASHLAELGRNLAAFGSLEVPSPVPGLTTSRVLTMDLVEGTKVTSIPGVRLAEIDGVGLVDELVHAWLLQVLRDGFVHADPHPGNVILTPDGRLALIDLGMVLRIRPQVRESLLRLVIAVSDHEVDHAVAAGIDLGTRREDFDEAGYRERVGELLATYRDLPSSELGLGQILLEVARTAGQSGLQPPPELTLLSRALLSLDQIGRALAPEIDIAESVQRHAGELLTTAALKQLSPSRLLQPMLDAKEFAEQLPGRANSILRSMADGSFRLDLDVVDEDRLLDTIRQLANRVTAGLILAALIIGAAMIMRVETSSTIAGYPALAMVFFLIAAIGGLALVGSILLGSKD